VQSALVGICVDLVDDVVRAMYTNERWTLCMLFAVFFFFSAENKVILIAIWVVTAHFPDADTGHNIPEATSAATATTKYEEEDHSRNGKDHLIRIQVQRIFIIIG
jgi:hypothetical protein